MKTGGPVRGLIARWVFRFEAAQGPINMVFRGITAVSTLTAALALIGAQEYAKWLLLAGLIGTPVFAFVYTEWGVYNRKNRESSDRGANWTGPDSYMNSVIGAMGTYYAMNHEPPDEEEYEEMKDAVEMAWKEYRDGIDINE